MPTRQGDLVLLEDPVAQRLLQSPGPARLACTWIDGTSREVPIHFHWNGTEALVDLASGTPELQTLHEGAKVKVTIDTNELPSSALIIRGSVRKGALMTCSLPYGEDMRTNPGGDGGGTRLATIDPAITETVLTLITPEYVTMLGFKPCVQNVGERDTELARTAR